MFPCHGTISSVFDLLGGQWTDETRDHSQTLGQIFCEGQREWMWKEYQIHIGEMNEMDVMTSDWVPHKISSSTVYEFELLFEILLFSHRNPPIQSSIGIWPKGDGWSSFSRNRTLTFKVVMFLESLEVNTLPETNIAPENGWLEY